VLDAAATMDCHQPAAGRMRPPLRRRHHRATQTSRAVFPPPARRGVTSLTHGVEATRATHAVRNASPWHLLPAHRVHATCTHHCARARATRAARVAAPRVRSHGHVALLARGIDRCRTHLAHASRVAPPPLRNYAPHIATAARAPLWKGAAACDRLVRVVGLRVPTRRVAAYAMRMRSGTNEGARHAPRTPITAAMPPTTPPPPQPSQPFDQQPSLSNQCTHVDANHAANRARPPPPSSPSYACFAVTQCIPHPPTRPPAHPPPRQSAQHVTGAPALDRVAMGTPSRVVRRRVATLGGGV
jgi:hypothetical protein